MAELTYQKVKVYKVTKKNRLKRKLERFQFSSIRRDWYIANAFLPRVVRGCLEGRRTREFHGFPRQWIPIFEWFGIPWANSIEPPEYIPFFSDLSEEAIVEIVNRAKSEKSLRILVESATMYDPILSDFLYIVDNTISTASPAMLNEMKEITEQPEKKKRRLILNGWQAYGRPSVRTLEAVVMKVKPKARIAVVLPCSFHRPYWKSKTHKKIYRILKEHKYRLEKLHRIVITSLGVLPEEVWDMPQVLTYDAGVPDIYRILRLVRSYFSEAGYQCVIDCLQFEPYSDVLKIVQREGIIKEIRKIKIPGQKHFYIHP